MLETLEALQVHTLPETYTESDILEVLPLYNARLRYAYPQAIRASIKEESQYLIVTNSKTAGWFPEYRSILYHSPEEIIASNPFQKYTAILVENRASFCSLLLNFDPQGNATLLHTPLNDPYTDFISQQSRLLLMYFLAQSDQLVSQPSLTILTGMNIQNQYQRNNLVKELIELIQKNSESHVSSLFVNPPQISTRRPSDFENHLPNYLPPLYNINGLVFIPAQITNSGLNEIFIKDQELPLGSILDILA